MPYFKYKGITNQGRVTDGAVEADNIEAAKKTIQKNGLRIQFINEEKQNILKKEINIAFLNKVSKKEIVIFLRQLAVMFEASLPIVQSFKIIAKQTENPKFKRIINEIANKIEGGAKMSYVMSKYPEVFSDYYVNMVKSGETSGNLDEVLVYLADQEEKSYDVMSKVKGALTYPIVVFIAMIAVFIIMMVYIVPKMLGAVTEMGGELPLPTKIIIGTSNFLKDNIILLIVFLIILTIGIILLLGTKKGKKLFHLAQIKLPMIGKFFQKIYLTRFTKSFSTLLRNGVPIIQSLRVAGDIIGNEVYKEVIEETISRAEDGDPISAVFSEHEDIIPVMVTQMILVGEKTGKLDYVLEKISGFYERESSNIVDSVVELITPLIIILLGIVVAIIVSAVILPMYNMANQF
ncbi:type II secretion system F family protein [Patescibacteria group bacterium]|nr:type II secretion system F family protein [Patescibacteria group bacterium]